MAAFLKDDFGAPGRPANRVQTAGLSAPILPVRFFPWLFKIGSVDIILIELPGISHSTGDQIFPLQLETADATLPANRART
jgi:hypothetical protein